MISSRHLRNDLILYAVTNRKWTGHKSLTEQVASAIRGGATMIQLREKSLSTEAFITEAIEIKKTASFHGVPLIINDNIEVAKIVKADGVHVGKSDHGVEAARTALGAHAIIGASVRTVEEAIRAEQSGADYLGVGAVFETSSKKDAVNVDLVTLKQITEAVSIPVVAIGGINVSNISQLSNTGIDGIAVISAIFASDDIESSTKRLRVLAEKVISKTHFTVPPILTIAGSDCSGGAGIQADLKTIEAHGLYGMSVITALTAQNTLGVTAVHNVPAAFIAEQLNTTFNDIVPAAIKIGMVSSPDIIKTIVTQLSDLLSIQSHIPIVIDPVMVSTSGSKLITDQALDVLKNELLPLATLITPNIPEAEILSGHKILTKNDMVEAACAISKDYNGHILIKGGHLTSCSDDLHYHLSKATWLQQARINNPNTHGTGCTLSTAIACALSNGLSMNQAISQAKEYITGALKVNFNIGKGSGPLYHSYNRIKST